MSETAKTCLSLKCNYDIDLANSAEQAFEQLIHKKYDAVVCDLKMPVMNGFEFLKKLRDQGNKIPFIVFTVTEDKQTAVKAFNYGATAFVGKYGKPELVFSTLKKCIDTAVNNTQKEM